MNSSAAFLSDKKHVLFDAPIDKDAYLHAGRRDDKSSVNREAAVNVAA